EGGFREVGFITVSRKHSSANIGLLAVDPSCRRLGIASALLSRATLWALEHLGYLPHTTLDVVTQGTNSIAIACYRAFGFRLASVQDVYHIWLPDDLPSVPQADQSMVPFCRQHLMGKEMGYILDLLGAGMDGKGGLTGGLDSVGRYNLACSSNIQSYLGEDSNRVLITPSCTAALELAAMLCTLAPGDEVIMPSYTFASTANAFVLRGAVPVFVDVCRETGNMDVCMVEAAVTSRTKVICAVHYAGVACDMDVVCAVAKKYGLLVVEDAAQGRWMCVWAWYSHFMYVVYVYARMSVFYMNAYTHVL
ncbi:aminotransferase class I/II-fold pyridoxal phosphate-dependent enzyme, partial [archaeon]